MSSTPAEISLIVAFAAMLVGVVFPVDALYGGRGGGGGIGKIGGPFPPIDHDGRHPTHFSHGTSAETMAGRIRENLSWRRGATHGR